MSFLEPVPELQQAATPQRPWIHLREALEEAGMAVPKALRRLAATYDHQEYRAEARRGYALLRIARYLETHYPSYRNARSRQLKQLERKEHRILKSCATLAMEGRRQLELLRQMDDLARPVWLRAFPREPIPSLQPVEEALHAVQQASSVNLLLHAITCLSNALLTVRAHRLERYEFLDGWDGFDLNHQVPRTTQVNPSVDAVDGWEGFMDGLEKLQRWQKSDPVKGLVEGLHCSLEALSRAFKKYDDLFSRGLERTGAPRLELSPAELGALQALVLQFKPLPER